LECVVALFVVLFDLELLFGEVFGFGFGFVVGGGGGGVCSSVLGCEECGWSVIGGVSGVFSDSGGVGNT